MYIFNEHIFVLFSNFYLPLYFNIHPTYHFFPQEFSIIKLIGALEIFYFFHGFRYPYQVTVIINALAQAQAGTHYEGFKVVEGRSNRKYTDEDAVAKAVTEAGYDPYEKKLLGITAMSSLLGKKKFEDLLGGLIYKPPGKPALVPESDKRPAMNTAADDFNDN